MTARKYALGLDYGTNSVRALLVDVRNGRELATAIHDYESGEAGIVLDPENPNLARQNPADYLKGIEAAVRQTLARARKADRVVRPGASHRHRRRHDGLDPDPRGPGGNAALLPQGIPEEPERHGLALEGPHRLRRGGGDHGPGRPTNTPNTWPSAAGRIPPNGSSARSSTACASIPRCSTRPGAGSNAATTSRPS